MARKFLITIGAETELDVHDVQSAVVAEGERVHDDDIDHGNVDVMLIEEATKQDQEDKNIQFLAYKVLDVC